MVLVIDPVSPLALTLDPFPVFLLFASELTDIIALVLSHFSLLGQWEPQSRLLGPILLCCSFCLLPILTLVSVAMCSLWYSFTLETVRYCLSCSRYALFCQPGHTYIILETTFEKYLLAYVCLFLGYFKEHVTW